MQAKWQGIDIQEVYVDWIEALGDCSLGAINDAIRQSRISQHPPNQGEFLAYCRQFKIDESKLLGHNRELDITIPREEKLRQLGEIKKQITEKMTEQTKDQS